jgi:hypothetical protein
MQKNNFCIFSKKSLKLSEAKNAPSHFLIYKNKEKESTNQFNQKLKEKIQDKRKSIISKQKENEFIFQNYILSTKILMKYNKNYNSVTINNLFIRKKCHFQAIYNDMKIYINTNIEYIKKYYTYNESIKIIPKRQAYFKHLMIYIEGPIYKNFIYNKILKRKGLEKLSLYKRTNYPKKYNKNNNIILSDNNIIFNSDVIETIENCSTSLTQCSNKKNNNININNNIIQTKNSAKKNINDSIISEIKTNGCRNRRSDSNISCIDNSLLMIMKDLAISQNVINRYLYNNNTNYKNLYNRMKSKSKTITIKNRKNKENQINIRNSKNKTIQNEINIKQHHNYKESENNLIKKIKQNSKSKMRSSISLIKKINNIKIKQFTSNSIKSSSLISSQNLNSLSNYNKYRFSLGNNKIHLNLNLRSNNKKFSSKEKNPISLNHFNNTIKPKRTNNFNNIKNNTNNKVILQSIKKIIEHQRTKNNSLRKYINTQKFLTDSTFCLLDMNSMNENETKKMIQTINPIKSISISNNQFFKCIKKFSTDINNEK